MIGKLRAVTFYMLKSEGVVTWQQLAELCERMRGKKDTFLLHAEKQMDNSMRKNGGTTKCVHFSNNKQISQKEQFIYIQVKCKIKLWVGEIINIKNIHHGSSFPETVSLFIIH